MTDVGHPAPLALERFSVGDLPPDVLRVTGAHVDSCAICTEYLVALESARAERLAAAPPAAFMKTLAARPASVTSSEARGAHRPRLVAGLAAVTLAAAALLLLLRRPGDGPGAGLKGMGLSIQRNRGADVHVLDESETIRAGDALRVVLTQSRATPVAAWFVDGHGRIDRFVGPPALPLPAGESPLPATVRVDNPCVDLALIVAPGDHVFVEVEDGMRRALAAGATPEGDAWVPEGAIVRRLRCD